MVVERCEYEVGDAIDGRYCVEKMLGKGSFGTVYKVRDPYGNTLALKILRLWEVYDTRDNLLKRFDMEYRVAQIKSRYFVHSFDYGSVGGNPYFTMEYCQRGDLSDKYKEYQNQLAQIAHDILMGLNDLHISGIVHRDLKWENVMMKDNGVIALTDFGIVGKKNTGLTGKSFLGRPREVFGTYIYMSPEQADMKGGGVTYLPTTDIFSFGVMIYEFLTGEFPFGKLETLEDLEPYQKNAKKEIWNRGLLRSVGDGFLWEKVIEKCLKADYRERYQSVKEVLRDIPRLNVKTDSGQERRTIGKVKRLIVTLGAEMGREYKLKELLTNNKRMLRLGRELDNDIVLKENETSYSSRYHCTLEIEKDSQNWTIRDGQWRKEQRQWIPSTNGTFINNQQLSSGNSLILHVGDIITIGDLKLLVETN